MNLIMKKQFVTYEIALKLKKLGFDEECLGIYNPELNMNIYGVGVNWNTENINDIKKEWCSAPLYQQIIDWLREKHLIDIDNGWCISNPLGKKQEGYNISVYDRIKDEFIVRDFHIDYYKAREQAILKAIELIKNENRH